MSTFRPSLTPSSMSACIGAALARAEAQIALAELIALPGLQLATDEPPWRSLQILHGP